MSDKEKYKKIINNALKAINEERDEGDQFIIESGLEIFGPNGMLDSLELVSLIVDIEERFADELDIIISLSDDKAMTQDNPPYSSVEIMLSYIESLLK